MTDSIRMRRPVVALLTDFGLEDAYVGIMKSVIAARCDADVIDLSHSAQPQNVRQAAYILWTAYRYLPNGAVTVCVVDPGVGTTRRPVAVRWDRGYFVGPDNGWLSYVLRDMAVRGRTTGETPLPATWAAVQLDRPEFWLTPVSQTFHGRDVFAPVASALASGANLEELGAPLSNLITLDPGLARERDGTVQGHIIHVDHFGNLITNISAGHLPARFTVTIGGGSVSGPSGSYQAEEPLIALVGSSGLLEIAAPNGSAARLIGAGIGAGVAVQSDPNHEGGTGS